MPVALHNTPIASVGNSSPGGGTTGAGWPVNTPWLLIFAIIVLVAAGGAGGLMLLLRRGVALAATSVEPPLPEDDPWPQNGVDWDETAPLRRVDPDDLP